MLCYETDRSYERSDVADMSRNHKSRHGAILGSSDEKEHSLKDLSFLFLDYLSFFLSTFRHVYCSGTDQHDS